MSLTNPHPICSVVIPTHNCLRYLKQAVASVQQQSVMNIEIIVVDDNSSDNTWSWLQFESIKDRRIRPFRLRAQSPAKARNFAVYLARGEWIAFLDADDLWLPHKLSRQLSFHQHHPDVHFSFGDYRHRDIHGNNLGTCFEFWQSSSNLQDQPPGYRKLAQSPSQLFGQNIVGTSTVMVKRAAFLAVKGFDESLVSAEDWDLWLKLALKVNVAIGSHCDTEYLMRPQSESSKTDLRIEAMRLIYQRYCKARDCATLWAKRTAQSRIRVAEAEKWLTLQQPDRAFYAHTWALLLAPSARRFMEALSDIRQWFLPSYRRRSSSNSSHPH